MASPNIDPTLPQAPLKSLAGVFLKLGTIAFGGPAAHIAMMEHEIVRRRGWIQHNDFLDLLGATNLIPGPNSTEMAIYIGHRQVGWRGLIVAGSCFILPAALIVTGLAWAYQRYGQVPKATAMLYGVKPVMIAVICQALWGLGKTAIKSASLLLISLLGMVISFLGFHELLILLGSGLAAVAISQLRATRSRNVSALSLSSNFMSQAAMASSGVTVAFSLGSLFLFFFKVGAVLFGSGYVLVAFLNADLVQRWHWLSESQLLDAIAIGQFTPGPVFTTATFIGYLLGGLKGAGVATLAIFLPAFLFVAGSGPLIPRIRRSAIAGAFLDGVNAASLALMLVVTIQLSKTALVDATTLILLIASLTALIAFRLNSVWLVMGGLAIGYLFH